MNTTPDMFVIIPILDVEDVNASVELFGRLGLIAYAVHGDPPTYACLRAGEAELHLRPKRLVRTPGPQSIRIRVRDVRALGEELRSRRVAFVHENQPTQGLHVEATPWGTLEFHIHEPNGHSITFYQNV
jgi:hypothetical protein